MLDVKLADVIDELVIANHILFHNGVVDGFGHVSVRHPDRADRFLLSRSIAPATVKAADILEYDLDGAPVVPNGPGVYLERFIHGEIYRARPDVMAVVHSHSPSVVPFGVVPSVPLRPIYHMASHLGAGAPVFEIRDHAGDCSSLLIDCQELGVALAGSLGDHTTVLMRGHGSTVVGNTLRQAVYRAIYTEMGAKLQASALSLGAVTYLTVGEAAAAMKVNDGTLNRSWTLWAQQAANAPPLG